MLIKFEVPKSELSNETQPFYIDPNEVVAICEHYILNYDSKYSGLCSRSGGVQISLRQGTNIVTEGKVEDIFQEITNPRKEIEESAEEDIYANLTSVTPEKLRKIRDNNFPTIIEKQIERALIRALNAAKDGQNSCTFLGDQELGTPDEVIEALREKGFQVERTLNVHNQPCAVISIKWDNGKENEWM